MIFKGVRITNVTLALVLALVISIIAVSLGSAQDNEATIERVPSMEVDKTGPLNPVGLAFSSASQSFYVIEEQRQGFAPATNSELVAISPLAERKSTTGLATIIENPLNVVFDNRNNRLLAYQPASGRLVELRENPDGSFGQSNIAIPDLKRLGIRDSRGLALDEKTGSLFILDAAGPKIFRAPLGTGSTSTVELVSAGLVSPRGIAFDPASGHLHVLDLADQTLYELTVSGRVVATRSLLPFNLKSPQSMLFAPSGDQTDDPGQMSLFVADSGEVLGRGAVPGTQGSPQVQEEAGVSIQGSGQIIEFTLVQPVEAEAISFTSTLVKTTNLAAISPPSPDPSGLAYLPASDRLMVTDGEVEETVNNMTHFQGANVWELTLAGSLLRTANISPVNPTSVAMSDEPTGVAWNPNNGHYYFADDTGSIDIYDLDPGPDGLVGTSDDSWTGFSTDIYGNGDAEGIAYDTLRNRLFVADGINAEVYEYTLNGALVNQFDVRAYGVIDPEAVEFNPNSGTLFIMSSNSSSPVMVETTIGGALLQTIDISAANPNTAAGLAYAPASNGLGAQRFYIVDRGVDNNTNPSIVDGKLYEMSAPLPGPTPTPGAAITPTNTVPPPPSGGPFYASFASGGALSGVSFADEDILTFDGQTWSLLFDGSDVGVGGVDLYAMSVENEESILMAFSGSVTLNGIAVTPQDIVRFEGTSFGSSTAGTFSMYLDGSDVGLDTTGEKIDALSVLPDGRVLISTTGSPSVPGVTGRDEDILAFTPSALGSNTSGTWAMYFDGSDVGLGESSGEDVDAVDAPDGYVYISTTGDFSVSGVAGADEDVFACTPASLGSVTSCIYSPALFFDGDAWGLSANDLDAFQFGTKMPVPSITATPTRTPTLPPANSPTPSRTPTLTNTPLAGVTPTWTPTGIPAGNSFFASFALSGTLSGVSFADEDILRFDGQNWNMWFDGSDVGAGSIDLFAFSMVDTDTALIVFSSAVTLDGMAVTPQDIVRFDATSLGANTAGTFSMYFNGVDVGLDATGESIDALSVLPDGRILVSMVGDVAVTGASGRDEDILAFTPVTLGSNTSGAWAIYFDGSDVGLSDTTYEDVNALDIVDGRLYLSATGLFSVTGIDGGGEDVFVCTPTSLGDLTACTYSPVLFFDGSLWGLDGNSVDGFHLAAIPSASAPSIDTAITASPTSVPPPTVLFLPSPTETPTETPPAEILPTSTSTATFSPELSSTVSPSATP